MKLILNEVISFNTDNLRTIAVGVSTPIIAFLSPTDGFIYALILAFSFNIFCGMRADGVSIIKCSNFSCSKFKNAIIELLVYLLIILVVFSGMKFAGDTNQALFVSKTISYVFMYVYFMNGIKNLIKAYPDKIALRIIYHVIRLEFKRASPEYLQEIIDRVELSNKEDKL